jgi:hypothetical protein
VSSTRKLPLLVFAGDDRARHGPGETDPSATAPALRTAVQSRVLHQGSDSGPLSAPVGRGAGCGKDDRERAEALPRPVGRTLVQAPRIALPIGPITGLAEVQNPQARAVKRESEEHWR